jgi:hypothetical protein
MKPALFASWSKYEYCDQKSSTWHRTVAGALHISHHTIRVQVKHVYRKLQVSNHVEELLVARKIGCF